MYLKKEPLELEVKLAIYHLRESSYMSTILKLKFREKPIIKKKLIEFNIKNIGKHKLNKKT